MSDCKECGLPVIWRKDPDAKGRRGMQCFNPDGTVHWDRCSAERFARIKRTGKHFIGKATEGYITPLKSSGVQLVRDSGKQIKGKAFKPSGRCQACVPPWEICPSVCPDAIKGRAIPQ